MLAAVFAVAPCANGEQGPKELKDCAALEDAAARLKCFDELAARAGQASPEPGVATEAAVSTAAEPSQLSRRWELDDASREPLFTVRPHKQNYMLLGRWSDSVNQAPYVPPDFDPDSVEFLDPVEVKFQLSLKLKLAEGLFNGNGDLWVAYTQQNQWQLYNSEISAPFRETNYEPEGMLTFRTDYSLLGMRGRFVTFGLNHQSNGRTDPISRSWNRIYAQFGFERGNFAMTIRPWYRLSEDAADDDNPDIDDYYGHGDVVLQYRRGGQVFALMGRGNVSEGKGAAQLDWSFPLYGAARGYVQAFSGYGESLVDYNHDQNTIGAGVILSDWF